MQLAGPGVFGPPRDPDAARAVLRRAIELGVDHIDTSQYYGPDVVNELIRETLHPYPDGLQARDEGRRAPRRAGRVAAGAAPGRAARRRRGQPALAAASSGWTSSTCALLDDGDGGPASRWPSSSARSRTCATRASSTSSASQQRHRRATSSRRSSSSTIAERAERLQRRSTARTRTLLDALPRARASPSCRSSRSAPPSRAARSELAERPGDRRGRRQARRDAVAGRARLAAAPRTTGSCSSPGRRRSRTSRRTWRRPTSSSTPTTWRRSRTSPRSRTRSRPEDRQDQAAAREPRRKCAIASAQQRARAARAARCPRVTSDAMPWIVANRTRPTRSGSPGSSAPSAWPCSMSSSITEKARSAASCSAPDGLAVLAGEHQLEQRRVRGGEADVGRGGRLQARLEVLAGAVDGGAQLGAEAVEPGLGQRVEQRLAIGEVAARRAVADADVARELAQRQRLARRARARCARPARAAPSRRLPW